jgi:hypothetical protein
MSQFLQLNSIPRGARTIRLEDMVCSFGVKRKTYCVKRKAYGARMLRFTFYSFTDEKFGC